MWERENVVCVWVWDRGGGISKLFKTEIPSLKQLCLPSCCQNFDETKMMFLIKFYSLLFTTEQNALKNVNNC